MPYGESSLFRRVLLFVLLLIGIALFSTLTLLWGSADLSLAAIRETLMQPLERDSVNARIIWELRMPRMIAAILGGGALSLSGLLLQTLFRNPLAGPYVLGISSGASLGVALLLLGGWGTATLGLISASGLGAAAVLIFILTLARWVRSPVSLLVLGLMVGYTVDALVSVLIHFSSAESLRGFVNWSFGSFGRLQLNQVGWFASSTFTGFLLALLSVKFLNALALGEEGARTLGIPIRTSRVVVLIAASLLAAVTTAFCGPIGFIGLAVPHLARGLFHTANHRLLIPATFVMGSLLALIAGWIAGGIGSAGTLPLNAITSLMGAPVVIWILLPRQARKWQ